MQQAEIKRVIFVNVLNVSMVFSQNLIMKKVNVPAKFIRRLASSKCTTAEDPFGRKLISNKKSADKEEKFVQKNIRVAVLGATSPTGQALSLLLKHNPLISQLFLYYHSSTVGMAADLRHVDTKSEVVGYVGKDLNLAIRVQPTNSRISTFSTTFLYRKQIS